MGEGVKSAESFGGSLRPKPRFTDFCANCRASLEQAERVLFVERDLGRCFCTEACINEYFQPIVDSMEEELRSLRGSDDLSEEASAELGRYRNLTLAEPDEVWVEKTETGELHYVFIASYRSEEDTFHYLVRCLTIDGNPSFVLMSFATKDPELVQKYRKGSEIALEGKTNAATAEAPGFSLSEALGDVSEEELDSGVLQFDAGEGGGEESLENPGVMPAYFMEEGEFAKMHQSLRQPGDIPRSAYSKFDPFVELTLDDPDEIWRFVDELGEEWFIFIASHDLSLPPEEADETGETLQEPNPGLDDFLMVCICHEVSEPTEARGASEGEPLRKLMRFEVVYAFPTIDQGLVNHFRKGIQSLHKSFRPWRTRIRAA